MAARSGVVMSRLVRTALVVAVALAGCSTGLAPSADIDPFQALPGKWGWEGSNDCREAPVEIRFHESGKRMHLSNAPETGNGGRELRRVAKYTVLGPIANGLGMSMDGEDRLDPSGRPVTWDLVMLSNDQFCWHRSDWPDTGCTKPVNRCET